MASKVEQDLLALYGESLNNADTAPISTSAELALRILTLALGLVYPTAHGNFDSQTLEEEKEGWPSTQVRCH